VRVTTDNPKKQLRRRLKAIQAAHAMHAAHPSMARDAGRKGARAQMAAYGMTASEWGKAMAKRRWSGGRTKLRIVSATVGEETTTR
jgi:hypothetical protein